LLEEDVELPFLVVSNGYPQEINRLFSRQPYHFLQPIILIDWLSVIGKMILKIFLLRSSKQFKKLSFTIVKLILTLALIYTKFCFGCLHRDLTIQSRYGPAL